MQSTRKFLKIINASISLFFVGALIHAQTVHAQTIDHKAGLALVGSKTPITNFSVADIATGSDGSREFMLDLIYQVNALPELAIGVQLLMIPADLEVTAVSNVVATASTADPSGLVGLAPPSSEAKTITVNGVAYTTGPALGWTDTGTGIVGFKATDSVDTWTTLLTLTFKYKKSGGNATIDFGQSTNGGADSVTGAQVLIEGPPVPQSASLTLSPTRADQSADANTVTLTCSLLDDAGAAKTAAAGAGCIVAPATVSFLATTGDPVGAGTDYTIDPAVAATISIAAGASSGTRDYTITAANDAEKLQFRFVVTHIVSATSADAVAAGDMLDSTRTFAIFKIVTAGVEFTMVDSNGACPATKEAAATSITIAEGASGGVCMALLSNPLANGPVQVTCTTADDAVGIVVSAGSFSYTMANWETSNLVTLRAPDNNIATGGSTPNTITCAAVGGGGDYPDDGSVTGAFTANVTDPDMVETTGELSASSTISEKGGAQPLNLSARIDGTIAPSADCSVTVSVTGTPTNIGDAKLAVSGTDYEAFSAPVITIAGGSLSGSASVQVTPKSDEDEFKEYIPFQATASCSGAGGSGATTFAKVAFTLIVDKGGMETAQNVSLAVVPVVTQLSLASTMANIESRADASRNTGANFSLAGNSSAESTLLDHMKRASSLDDVRDYDYDWKRALADSSFAMPVSGFGGATLWASGDYRTLNGNNGVTDWEGNSFLLNFGADTRLNNDMLVGAMLSLSESDIDYKENSLGTVSKGEYTLEGMSFRPYFAWSTGSTDIWGSIGFGTGELELRDESETGSTNESRTSDTSDTSVSLGIEQGLVEGLSVKADLAINTTEIDGKKEGDTDIIGQQEVESQRARLLLAGKNAYNSANGTITPNVEIGIRYDTTETDKATAVGDDEFKAREDTSTGAEAAMGVDFANAATGLTLSLKARFYSGNDYDEWGISGVVEKKTAPGGLGLSFNMRPTYGDTQSKVNNIWNQSFSDSMKDSTTTTTAAEKVYAASMNSDFAYGFAVPGSRGVLTPYAKAVLGGDVASRHTLGLRWKPHSRFNIDVHGEDHSTANDYRMVLHWVNKRLLDFTLTGQRSEGTSIDHSLVLKGTLDF